MPNQDDRRVSSMLSVKRLAVWLLSVTGCEYSSKNVTDLSGLSARCFTDGKEVISSLSYSEVHTTTWILQRSKLHKPRRHIRVVFTRIVTKLIFNSVHQ